MTSLILTLAIFTGLVLSIERISWILLRRKMEPLRFPSPKDPTGSHSYYLHKLRTLSIVHTVLMLVCIWSFLIALW